MGHGAWSMGNLDPSSSDKAGLPSSLFELRRDMMPRLKMRIAERELRNADCGFIVSLRSVYHKNRLFDPDAHSRQNGFEFLEHKRKIK